jgi:hypothetical protein
VCDRGRERAETMCVRAHVVRARRSASAHKQKICFWREDTRRGGVIIYPAGFGSGQLPGSLTMVVVDDAGAVVGDDDGDE